MSTFEFALPDDSNTISSLIRTVPDGWSWLDGGLYAPKRLVNDGLATPDTGYALSRFRGGRAEVTGRTIREGEVTREAAPDLFGFLVERKRPAWVSFEEAGYQNSHDLTLALAKRLASGFVHLGYRGFLRFYSDCFRNSKYRNPARLYLEMASGDCHGAGVRDKDGIAIVTWDAECNGTKDMVGGLLDLCRKLELKEAASDSR